MSRVRQELDHSVGNERMAAYALKAAIVRARTPAIIYSRLVFSDVMPGSHKASGQYPLVACPVLHPLSDQLSAGRISGQYRIGIRNREAIRASRLLGASSSYSATFAAFFAMARPVSVCL